MPHLIQTHATPEAAQEVAKTREPFGPGFPNTVVEKIAKLEVWGSSLKDPGGDYCEFRAFDADGKTIDSRRLGGY